MTSRTPRDTRLRLVPGQPIAAARRAVTAPHRRPAPRPPAGTPPREQLARQARTVLGDAVRLARWVQRTGSPADPDPEQTAEELQISAERVRAQWDRARLAGLIELHHGRARPGWRLRAWDRDDAAVLRGWVALFDAWSLAHPVPPTADPSLVAEVVEAAPQLLSLMHLSAGPVTEPALLDLLRQRVAELRAERDGASSTGDASAAGPTQPSQPPVDVQQPAGELPTLLDWALDGIAATGALVRCPAPTSGEKAAEQDFEQDSEQDCAQSHEHTAGGVAAEPQPGSGAGAESSAPAGPGQAMLTPLGNWAVWMKLEQICVAAQSPAGNIEQSAEHMLRGCARLSPGPARAEYRAWLAARPVGPAVAELLDAARGEDALLRGLAFEALRVVGAPAEPAVRDAAEESTLRPYALLWLAEHEGADPEELTAVPGVLTREEATWLWVDTAAAVADHGESHLLVDHLEAAVQNSVPRLLEEVRATGHPRTVQVLVALAAAHPDPALAKAVRRAAFQVHTGGS